MAAEQAVSVGVGGEAHVELVGGGVVGLVVGGERSGEGALAAGGVVSCDAALLVGGGAEREVARLG